MIAFSRINPNNSAFYNIGSKVSSLRMEVLDMSYEFYDSIERYCLSIVHFLRIVLIFVYIRRKSQRVITCKMTGI